jgi:hypothetical protein
MTKVFDHKIVKFELGWKGFDHEDMERQLKDLGSQGWEAVPCPLRTGQRGRDVADVAGCDLRQVRHTEPLRRALRPRVAADEADEGIRPLRAG